MTKEVEAALKAYKEAEEVWRQARLAEQATWRARRKASLDLLKACAESGEDYGLPAGSAEIILESYSSLGCV